MTKFGDSEWAKPDFSREYRDKADIYVVERKRLFEVLKSFWRHFLTGEGEKKVLDLGCGDGIVTRELLEIDDKIEVTLVDGSTDMLDHAKRRLADFTNLQYLLASFQEIIEGKSQLGSFDFIVSSLAIHHLTLGEKRKLYHKIYAHLTPGGYFLNIDLVRAGEEELEEWYMGLWREWIEERKRLLGLKEDIFGDILRRYKENEDNKPDTLGAQLAILKEIGFHEVDCHYKYGIFTIFGGKRL
jgi:tRNA (cmo5U34)-methyltransferase